KGGKNERARPDLNFYGLPVKSDRVLFIIDASASMKLPTKNENPAEKWKGPVTPEDGKAPPPPPEEILSGPKIDVAKHELKKALQRLPETAKFNIVAFNSAVISWKDKMMTATPANKQNALKWVRALQPRGSTYIDGALRQAFRMAGLGATDKAYPEVNIDTMVLLSDGAPTDDGYPNAKLMDPNVILEHVREWNRQHRIVIHCIGVDMLPWIEFLKKLAAENGGKYVDR
ncbi:MAG: VWA domain-containing protein, partial [Planctomycetota bacterium]